ncbi:acyl-CoA dehydrogenase family protein [Streptomyces chartreusis]|uniref:acyl-CoA dehydrogenase family protein n=1 Tax=Streptomyces chartreusis TaxID=1969 RepID=UPI0036890FD7
MPAAILPHSFLTAAQLRLFQEAEVFAASRLTALASQLEERGPHTNRDARQILSETGWLGLLIDTEDGSLGLDRTAKTLVLQAISRVCPAASATLQASVLGSAHIAEYGSEELRRRLLPEMAAGRCWPSTVVTDPEPRTLRDADRFQGIVRDGVRAAVDVLKIPTPPPAS